MKTIQKIGLLAFAVGVVLFNLTLGHNELQRTEGTLLANIAGMQASASEAYCDPVSQNSCKITTTVDGQTVSVAGVGQPTWHN